MPKKYSLHHTRRFQESYQREWEYSVDNFGEDHAIKYFNKIDRKIESLQEWRPERARGKNGQYRIIDSIDGIYILYHIDDSKKVVTLVEIDGKRRFQQMAREAETRKRIIGRIKETPLLQVHPKKKED